MILVVILVMKIKNFRMKLMIVTALAVNMIDKIRIMMMIAIIRMPMVFMMMTIVMIAMIRMSMCLQ